MSQRRMGGPAPPARGPGRAVVMQMEAPFQHQNVELARLHQDNQRLATTHVALRQELAGAQGEIQRLQQTMGLMQADNRGLVEKAMKMETDLRAFDVMRMEVLQVRQELSTCHAKRQDVEQQSQYLLRDNGLMLADLQKAAPAAQEAESLRQEVQHLRASLEFEQKGAAQLRDTSAALTREVEALKAPYGKAAAVNGYGAYTAGYVPQVQAQVSTGEVTTWAAQEAGGEYGAPQEDGSQYGRPPSSIPSHLAARPEEEWVEHRGPENRPFYFNPATGVSQWEKPPSMTPPTYTQKPTYAQPTYRQQQYRGAPTATTTSATPATATATASPHVSAGPLLHHRPATPEESKGADRGGGLLTPPRSGPGHGPPGANLFVFGLPDDFTDGQLYSLFAKFGGTLHAKVVTDKETGRAKNFGFVDMATSHAADAAMSGMNGVVLQGRKLKVERRRGEGEGVEDGKRHQQGHRYRPY